jgi:hypothetical protein
MFSEEQIQSIVTIALEIAGIVLAFLLVQFRAWAKKSAEAYIKKL